MSTKQFTPEIELSHGEMLANRIKKQLKKFKGLYQKQGIDCFRLYDWDIPEVRAVADWYKGHIVLAEYVREQTSPYYLERLGGVIAEALQMESTMIHLKKRVTGSGNAPRYREKAFKKRKKDIQEHRIIVRENQLKFYVDMDNFLDTGLYSDHRQTRQRIIQEAKGKRFLNLFCYTGAFTTAAALGGAAHTYSVDRNETYLNWLRDHLELNQLHGEQHEIVQNDVEQSLDEMAKTNIRFNLAVVDPPSFFQDRKTGDSFDVVRDHPRLLDKVVSVMERGSKFYFSNNHQRFEPNFEALKASSIQEITHLTIPEDFRNKKVHRCWEISL